MPLAPLRTSLGGVRAHTRAVFGEVVDKWPVWFAWGIGATGEHKQGRALDFMTYSDGTVKRPGPIRQQVGQEIADYLWSNRTRLGVWYVIYRRRIISVNDNSYGRSGRWNPMADRGSPTANHEDHVHVSFLDKPPAYRAPVPPASANGDVPYIVAAGDTLAAIADRFDVTVEQIAAHNKLTDPDRIDVGQRLLIPQPQKDDMADNPWSIRLNPGPTADRVGDYDPDKSWPASDFLTGADAKLRRLTKDEANRYEDLLANHKATQQAVADLTRAVDELAAKVNGGTQ